MERNMRDAYRLQELITQREGMIAENQSRANKGLAQAYGEEAFAGLANEIGLLWRNG